METERHIGRRIAEIRKQKGMTQEYIASLFGNTPQWLSNIEREVRPISADELAKLAAILGVEPGIFFATTSPKPAQSKGGEVIFARG